MFNLGEVFLVRMLKSEYGGKKYNLFIFIRFKLEIDDFWIEVFIYVRFMLKRSKMV